MTESVLLSAVRDPLEQRKAALDAAVRLHGPAFLQPGIDADATYTAHVDRVLDTATRFTHWLGGTTRLRLTPGPVLAEDAGHQPEGENAVTQLNTGQQFTLTADTEDASGYDTPERVEWSIDNTEVASLTASEDGKTATIVSGAPGTATVTATLPDLGLSATHAVDVVPAGTATINLVAGDVVDETTE